MATHFFHSDMVGAPTNTNAAGSTLAIIRAVLSTGFNLLTPQSATVAGGVMTLGYSAPHGYEDKVLLRLDGAPGGSVVRRVTASAGSSILTIPAPEFADGPVGGSLSTRVAPAGWEEVFTDAGVGVFRSTVLGAGSTRFYYRVADTVGGNKVDMLRGYESMTDANTGTGPFPTAAQIGGNGVNVSRSQDGSARYWAAFVDQRTLYIFLESSAADRVAGLVIGDADGYSSTDSFCAIVHSGSVAGAETLYAPRISINSGSAVTVKALPRFGVKSGTLTAFSSTIDGGFVLDKPVLIRETGGVRGALRGLMHASTNNMSASKRYVELLDVAGVSGRVILTRDAVGDGGAVAFAIDENWV